MRIAQIMAGAAHGGAELFYERLSIALHDAGDAVLPILRPDAARIARLRAAGLAPATLAFGGLLDRRTRPRLAALLRTHAPHAAIAWMGRAAAALPAGPWTAIGRLGGYYDLRRFATCRHLVANTRHIADWIVAQGIPAARVTHLPNFVPDLHGAPPADRAALGVPPGAALLLGLGRLHPAKGFATLVRALPHLPHAHAVIAGEGTERRALVRLARSLHVADRLHLPGWRTDIGALLAAADVFVCPSRHEPLGNMILEAWSAARPVVAVDSPGPSALIAPDDTGLIVPPDDPAALAAAITRAQATPHLGPAGRAAYLAACTPALVTARWRDYLAQVTAGGTA